MNKKSRFLSWNIDFSSWNLITAGPDEWMEPVTDEEYNKLK
ncbi:hypothetical protein [Tepidibacillus marianensis]